jgi:hypothetical protein
MFGDTHSGRLNFSRSAVIQQLSLLNILVQFVILKVERKDLRYRFSYQVAHGITTPKQQPSVPVT